MDKTKLTADNKKISLVTHVGVLVNLGLGIGKLVFGLLGGSIALVADGVHSFSDLATDVAVLLGIHFGSKDPDYEHPYGHGRMETFASIIVAIVLIAVGAEMIREAAVSIARVHAINELREKLGIEVLLISLVSVVLKEGLYWFTRTIAMKTHSSVLYANAWHHRSDALSSIAVIIGFFCVRAGYEYGDQVAAIAVGLMVILVGVKVIGGCIGECAEKAVDEITLENIKQVISEEAGVCSWHNLRTRTLGREIFMDLHILVNPSLTVAQSHEIAESLENSMHNKIFRPVNITVHVEPDIPKMRKEND